MQRLTVSTVTNIELKMMRNFFGYLSINTFQRRWSTVSRIGMITSFLLTGMVNVFATGSSDSTRIAKREHEIATRKQDSLMHASVVYKTFEGLVTSIDNNLPDPIVIPEVMLADSTTEQRNHAHALLEKVLAGQRFLESLDALQEIDLPVGVVKSGGAVDYSILIDRISFNSKGAMMDVYMSVAIPQTGDRIAFHGKVPLSAKGGIAGSAKIYLLGDHPIAFSGSTLFTIKGSNNTYVEFDCSGFKGMSIEAEVQFSRDLIIPEDEKGNPVPEPARVKTSFTTYIQSLNDMMVGITLPSFQMKGLKGFGFSVQQAYMDWSDLANPPGITFPQGYTSTFTQGGTDNLWQGFYLGRLEVKLPSSFAKRNDSKRVTLGVEHMILDDQGFSGNIFGENVIEAGDMSSWSYTLDRIAVELVVNQVKGFELAGKLTIPVIKGKDGTPTQFGYQAQRGADGNYIFAVKIQDEVKMPLFVADVKLFPGSSVTVKERNNKFYPSVMLNGELSIRAAKAAFNSIKFQGLVISSETPHFSLGTFGFGKEGSSSDFSKFPVAFNNITTKSEGDRVGIGFDLTINIGGKAEEGGFGGTASLTVWGKRNSTSTVNAEGQVTTTQGDWAFDKVDLSGIGVNIRKPGVIELAGMVNFFEADATYGEGFKGSLKGKIQSITLKAEALFGKTPTFRYWYADALVELKTGVPIVPGVMSAFGFGGGFYSKMKQSTQPVASSLGKTESGITYVPDENSMGIRAIVLIGSARPEAWNGDVALEVALNKHGGINSVTFTGNANFMSPMAVAGDKIKEMTSSAVGGKLAEKLASLVRGQVYGSVKLFFDNVNDVFHGNLEIYVNVAGGLVRGVSDGNKAGWAVLHFEKSDWYVLIGTPDQPIGLEVARIFKAKSYFMLGKNLPGSPPPPSQVTEILGDVQLDYMRDLNALQSGTGFAFGLHFLMDTGDLKFLMFYARFAAGTGLDFMLKDYGENCHCEGSSGPIGIKGWYANGQAYAFVMGKIGIKVKLRFIRGKFDILSIGAAAILQAKGPNPFWMHGIVGGYYRILGGLVKGHCKFEMTIGKDCKIVIPQSDEEINPLADVTIIADASPVQDAKEVDVFTAPQVAFNMPINEVFDITDAAESRRLFRGKLESFKVLDGSNSLVGNIRWNETNDVAAFDAFDVLPPQKPLKVFVKVLFEEFVEGQWRSMYFEGKPLEETKEVTFTTGTAPDYIPPSNVDISYPAVGQFNFYPKEYSQGFIELKKGQGYLFKPGPEWIQKLRITEALGQSYLETDLTYNESERRIYFNMPAGLQTSKPYRLEIMNFPRQNQAVDANVKNVAKDVGASGTELTVTTKQVEGNLELREVKSLYGSLFKTSKFNTFKEKVSAISLSATFMESVAMPVFQLGAYLRGNEFFDKAEIAERFGDRQVQFEAVLDMNNWYENKVKPLVYDGYPLIGNMNIRHRNVQEFGLPPVKSLFIEQPTYYPVLTEDNLSDAFNSPSVFNSIRYDLMSPMYLDYLDIQNQVANYVIDNPGAATERLHALLITPFPAYVSGNYKVRIKYVIPRINKTTSTHDWELVNIQN